MFPKLYLGHLFFTKCPLLRSSDQLLPCLFGFFSFIAADLILDILDISFYLGPISYLSNEIPAGSKEIGWFDFSFTLCMLSPCYWISEKYHICPSRCLAAPLSCHSLHEYPRSNLFWKILLVGSKSTEIAPLYLFLSIASLSLFVVLHTSLNWPRVSFRILNLHILK